MRTANYTDLRANLKGYIDLVIDDCDTVVINRGNGTGVIMISLDEYNSLKETAYIMSSPDTMNAIRKGEEDIKLGHAIAQNEGESMDDFRKMLLSHTGLSGDEHTQIRACDLHGNLYVSIQQRTLTDDAETLFDS